MKKAMLEYIDAIKSSLENIPLDKIEQTVNILSRAYKNGKSVFIFGNGGSAATAAHFACDINKCVRCDDGKRMKVYCLNDNIPTMLAYANDVSYRDIFMEQLKNFLDRHDVVIGISGSGNSENVINAVQYAGSIGATTVSFTGFDGGRLAKISEIAVIIPVNDMQKSEDTHLIITHMVMRALRDKISVL